MYTFLLRVSRRDAVAPVREALEEAGIPHRSGLLAGRHPSVIFTVPRDRLDEAREVLVDRLGDSRPDLPASAHQFPTRPVLVVGSLILVHFLLVFWMMASEETGRSLVSRGGLLKGATLDEPWRLLTSLFLHADPQHVFWNGASMMVFAVPLLIDLDYVRTAMIYLLSGLGGGLTALRFAEAGTLIIGSSGAVAGLFGAWVVLTLGRAHLAPLTWRARIRTIGVAMLVLPSLLTPVTSSGHSVSIGSHIGGLATGMAIGAAISIGLLRRMTLAVAGEGEIH